ncbi:MAG: response regulator, partial [Planctomycetota bacterium]
ILQTDGHDLRAVSTPAALHDEIGESRPDIVLLDMNMGRESGHEVLQQIRDRWGKICVIVVTGFPSMDSMRETFKADIYDYLAKPFSIDDLRKVLAAAAAEFGLGGRPQDKLRKELGRQIRLARTERSWTLKDLSEASSVSVSQLSSIERGAHLPSLESLLAVANALQSQPSTWFSNAGF